MTALELLRELVDALQDEVYPTFPDQNKAHAFIEAKAGKKISHSIAVKVCMMKAMQLLGSTESLDELFRRFS